MQGGYTILGRGNIDALAQAVNEYMVGGWTPQGGPFQGETRKGSAVAMHGGKPQLLWFQAMVLSPEALEQYRDEEDRIVLEEATRITTPGKQALGAEEYREEGK